VNPVMLSEQELAEYFKSVKAENCSLSAINEIYYYGAGCATETICEKTAHALRRVWPEADITVASDLVGAAKSLFGDRPGIACILGTGSNSGVYNGKEITSNIPPMGFILGDEGSGTALGKRLIKELFKSNIDENLKKMILSETGLSLPDIIRHVYRGKSPNKFIASLVPIIRKHVDSPFIHNMVMEEFEEFFHRNVCLYPEKDSLPVSFIGSVALHFEPILRKVAEKENIAVCEVKQRPMEGLVEFHLRK
ncbi:MAG: ATPase, partial [Muribaculaceae bacterium]|nr:ATPase [Muribaculaceae bacterium]